MTSKTLKQQLKNLYKGQVPDKMVFLQTQVTFPDVGFETLEDYININDTSLNVDHNKPFRLIFGEVISIKRAIDYAVYPDYSPEHLMKPILPKQVIKRLVKKNSIPNYWAYIGIIVGERINQDKKLLELIMSGKEFIDVSIVETDTVSGKSKVILPNTVNGMYVGVIRHISKVYREYHGTGEFVPKIKEAINELKKYKSLSVYEGMPFKTDNNDL